MKTNVYIDGFNLYYRFLTKTPYKWLNPLALATLVLGPRNDIRRIRYFTARLLPMPFNPQAPARQQVYLRALATIPILSIHYGHFYSNPVRMPLAHPQPGGPRTVEVIRTDEKGSDVNLASYLLLDAFNREYDAAFVISNDSDLGTPIKLAREAFGVNIGVGLPQDKPSVVLQQVATFRRWIRVGPLGASQFPNPLTDAAGSFSKPAGW